MKKIVRLTEGDLHNIIRKSVNNIIQELDWRTYANAANKSVERRNGYKEKSKEKKWYDSILPSMARKRQDKFLNLADKEYDRSRRFASAANNAVKDQLGYKSKNGFEYNPSIRLDYDERVYPDSYTNKRIDGNRYDSYGNEYGVWDSNGEFKKQREWHPDYDFALRLIKDVDDDHNREILNTAKKELPTPYEKGRMNKGNRELGDWYNGKTKYKNGRYETEE